MLLFFVMLFFRIKSLTPNHFRAKQTDFGRIFSSFIDDIYNANISEEHACVQVDAHNCSKVYRVILS